MYMYLRLTFLIPPNPFYYLYSPLNIGQLHFHFTHVLSASSLLLTLLKLYPWVKCTAYTLSDMVYISLCM